MRNIIALAFVFVLCPLAARAAEPGKISKETFTSEGKKRVYYLYVPKSVAEAKTAAPLLVTLHGSGRDGRILVEHWKATADREGFILAGPDSASAGSPGGGWLIGRDGPDFLRDVVEDVKAKYAVNSRRVYLFGHSAGGGFAIYMAVTESEYFTAVFVHAGAVPEEGRAAFDKVKRKIPVGLVVGTADPFFPVEAVRSTRDALKARGIEAPLTEIKGHTHDYYGRSKEVNKLAWDFLKDKELEAEPKFTQYRYN